MLNSDLIKKPKKEPCKHYDSVVGSILDKYVPTREYKNITQKTTNSMDDSINNEG